MRLIYVVLQEANGKVYQDVEDGLELVWEDDLAFVVVESVGGHELPCSLKSIISTTKSSEVHYTYRAERLVWAGSIFGQLTAMVPVVHQAASIHLDHDISCADVTMKAIEPKIHLNSC